MKRLSREFYARSTLTVARELIGKRLVRHVDAGRRTPLAGRIVETEAYLGADDRASHAARRTSVRARIMYGTPGHAYIYQIYGMYYCLNAVTEVDGTAGAVLVRALEPVSGVEQMAVNRGRPMPVERLARGPGCLCQALALDTALNGLDLCGDALWIEDDGEGDPVVDEGPRVGVDYAQEDALKPWRFWEAGNRCVSRPRRKTSS